jgi:hypothetical protein
MSLFDSLPCRQAGAQSDTGSNQQPDSQNLSTSELLNFVKLSNFEPPNLGQPASSTKQQATPPVPSGTFGQAATS